MSLSTAFGCPFDGVVAAETVMDTIVRLVDIGVTSVTLCDTTGVANPAQVRALFSQVIERWPHLEITAHFHDTRGMGLANAAAALGADVIRFDASLAGLGGCPYAPGASGNVCTEDLAHMFDAMGHCTRIDFEALLTVSGCVPSLLERNVSSQLSKAGPWNRQYPLPESAARLRREVCNDF